MSMKIRVLALGLALGCVAAPALAQDDAPELATPAAAGGSERGAEHVWITKLYEAFGKSDWQEVTSSFQHLRDNYSGTLENKELLFLNAQAQFNLKEYKAAQTTLEILIGLQEDHIGGLFLMAQIHAQNKGSATAVETSKDLLLQSARAGQYVLRDISSKQGKKVFAPLLKDSTFILRVMTASRDFQVSPSGLRNPFKSPLKEITGDGEVVKSPETVGADSERIKQLEARIEALFAQIERLAQDRQIEELIGKFTELRQIMTEFGQEGADLVKEKKKKWDAKLAAYSEVQLSIQLQIYINEGNQYLRTMAEAIRNEEYDTALEKFGLIKELKDQMYNEEREVFHRNAEALFLRGKALAERAQRLKKISEFVLDVSGIIVAPPNSDEKDSSIINDRIYQEGDAIIDTETDEEIEGLTVVEIVRSTVRFRYEDTEFVRELKSPQ